MRRIVRHLNTAVIDAMRRGAREMFKVHADSCEATMIEDVTKLQTLLSLQVQLQDAGNCFEPHPFLDNTLGDVVAVAGVGLPRYRIDGTGTALKRVEGWLRRDYFAVKFAVDQLNAELGEMRQSAATGTAFTPTTTTTTPARNGVIPERYQEPEDAAKARQLRVSRAVAHGEGEIGRGRSALVGDGMRVDPTEERVAKLLSKFKPSARKLRGNRNRRDHPDNARHPAGVPARFDIPNCNKVSPPEMSRTEVRRCIMTMPRAVGTGIDCIGRQYLEEMMHLEDVTILMNLHGAARRATAGSCSGPSRWSSVDDRQAESTGRCATHRAAVSYHTDGGQATHIQWRQGHQAGGRPLAGCRRCGCGLRDHVVDIPAGHVS